MIYLKMNDYMTKTDMKFFKKARKVALLSDYKNNVLLKFGDNPEFRFNTKEVKREDLLEIFKSMFDKLLEQ